MTRAGFAATLSKPFDLTDLLATLQRVISKSECRNAPQPG
jgi:hypothetical protein